MIVAPCSRPLTRASTSTSSPSTPIAVWLLAVAITRTRLGPTSVTGSSPARTHQRQPRPRPVSLDRVVRDSRTAQRGYPGVPPTLNLLLPAVPANVATARRAISGLCEHLDIHGEAAGDIRLAVSEACTACVEHSRGAESHPRLGDRCNRRGRCPARRRAGLRRRARTRPDQGRQPRSRHEARDTPRAAHGRLVAERRRPARGDELPDPAVALQAATHAGAPPGRARSPAPRKCHGDGSSAAETTPSAVARSWETWPSRAPGTAKRSTMSGTSTGNLALPRASPKRPGNREHRPARRPRPAQPERCSCRTRSTSRSRARVMRTAIQ